MSLTDSPSFDDAGSDSLLQPDSELPEAPQKPRSRLRPLLIALAALVLILIGMNIVTELGPGYGTVMGRVHDLNNNPVEAEVFVSGSRDSVMTDASGQFELQNVPGGAQTLAVGFLSEADTFLIQVPGGDSIDVGVLQIDPDSREGAS